jgi:hypothetical protein
MLFCLVAVAMSAPFTTVRTGAQAMTEAPGAHRPVAPSKPRIAPLPEAEWTDVHRQQIAKYSRDGRADNALRTLMNLPEFVDGVMP